MRHWIFKWFLVAGLIIAADKMGGWMLRMAEQRQKSGPEWASNQKLFQAPVQTAILGSSRAQGHYSDTTIERISGKRTLTFGVPGTGLIYQYFQLLMLESRAQKIENVVLDFKPYELSEPVDYDELIFGFPMIHNSKAAVRFIHEQMPKEKWKMLSSLYPYNNRVPQLIQGLFPGKQLLTGFKGHGEKRFPVKRSVLKEEKIYPDAVRWMDSIIALSKKNQWRLMVVVSPYYGDITSSESIRLMKSTCSKQGIECIDYSGPENSFSASEDWFVDDRHLTTAGALAFSSDFAKHHLNKPNP